MFNKMHALALLLLCIYATTTIISANCKDEFCTYNDLKAAKAYLAEQNELLRQRRHRQYLAEYNYNTNVTEANRAAMNAVAAENAKLNKEMALKIRQRNFSHLNDEFISRQVQILSELGLNILEESDYKALQNAISSMQSNYATATVCDFEDRQKCDLQLEPHIQARLVHSRNPKELAYYWQQWHDKAGTSMRQHFKTYVEKTRLAAKLNGYESFADYWIHFYDDPQFESNLDAAYQALLPFYSELHAYVRQRLFELYGAEVLSATGKIPIHLLGNMWGQTWHQIIDLITPYPQVGFLDITAELQHQNYTVLDFFKLGDEFFKSLHMLPLPASFWQLSVIERPKDVEIICHASAWDLFENSDVRIKMCTEVNANYLYVVHHELGHIQYYLQYEKQPTAFRDAPNPGFHEAVGDTIALSVMSMKHLKSIGLTQEQHLNEQQRINELFRTAMMKVVFLPFAYTMDKFRYAVFRNEIPESKWNSEFWKMRANFTGVEPAVPRTDDDFDAPAKYHISANVEYLRYFAAHIFQFQFHKALCSKAGQYRAGDEQLTLDNYDIYQSKEAGAAFGRFLSLGAAKNWRDALEEMTGQREMDTSALLEFFEPLRNWLRAENKRLGVQTGW